MMRVASGILGVALVLGMNGGAWAQTAAPAKPATETTTAQTSSDAAARAARDAYYSQLPVRTFYLKNVTQPNDGNEILTALRNIHPPDLKLYLVPSQNAIIVRGTLEQMDLTQKIINELDRPKKSFRLTYTITEMDGGKRVGAPQHFAMIVADGQSVTLNQGSRVPVSTGTGGSPGVDTQFTYIDTGTNFAATVTSDDAGARLKSKVDQSGAAESVMIGQSHEPVIRHTTLEGTSLLTLGKPLMLGSLDVPGSTAHLEVEAVIEALP